MAAALLLSGCWASTSHEQAGTGPAAYTFTCCTARDVKHVYHPGDVVTVHWMKQADPSMRGPGASVTLEAELGGSFDRVSDAKSGRPDAIVLRAAPLHVDDPASARPTSRIRIPRTAPLGLYNLTITIDSAGSRITGTSLITVRAR